MMVYRLGLFLTLVVILFFATMHIGAKEPYRLNRWVEKTNTGLRLWNKFYLLWLLPWSFVPFIDSLYFRTYYVLYILLFTLALEVGLYLLGLYTGKNKEHFLVMLLFTLVLVLLMALLIHYYLEGFVPFQLYTYL